VWHEAYQRTVWTEWATRALFTKKVLIFGAARHRSPQGGDLFAGLSKPASLKLKRYMNNFGMAECREQLQGWHHEILASSAASSSSVLIRSCWSFVPVPINHAPLVHAREYGLVRRWSRPRDPWSVFQALQGLPTTWGTSRFCNGAAPRKIKICARGQQCPLICMIRYHSQLQDGTYSCAIRYLRLS